MSDSIVEQFLKTLQQRPATYLVGIAGVPGSGKTTFCREVLSHLPDAVVVPMDGYHLPRVQLDAEGLRRRGALHTFDGEAFYRDVRSLKENHDGVFPSFDHAEKDPRPNAIRVTGDARIVIIEGIYVLMGSWRAEPLFELRVFLDCDLDEAVDRLAVRHVQTGLSTTLREGRHRAVTNDRVNAEVILSDGCRERADLVLPTAYKAERDLEFDRQIDREFSELFPWRETSPEEYAIQRARRLVDYSYHLYRFDDPAMGQWARRLGVVLSSPEEIARAHRAT